MPFTRSTKDMNIHQSLPDYPSADEGITAEDLKILFDSGAVQLQIDLNRLETELEASAAAAKLGAAKIYSNDDSAANVQAKLTKLYDMIQEVIQTGIADNAVTTAKIANGAVTQAKINSTYEATLAKKNGTKQTNLYAENSEQLGGSTLEQLITRVSSYMTTGSVSVSSQSSVTSFTINLGFVPNFLMYFTNSTSTISSNLGFIFSNKLIYFTTGDFAKFQTDDVTISSEGVVTIPKHVSGTVYYMAIKSSL